VHELIGFTVAGLLLVHISGALYHYFIRRDGVLQRMLP
jgi:cytochrome b561